MAATGESRAHETLMAVPRERPGWHIHPRRFSTSQVSLSPKLTQQEMHNINATGKRDQIYPKHLTTLLAHTKHKGQSRKLNTDAHACTHILRPTDLASFLKLAFSVT